MSTFEDLVKSNLIITNSFDDGKTIDSIQILGNQAIDHLIFPSSIRKIYLEDCESLENVKWPVNLRALFITHFNRPLIDISFPDTIQTMYFGDKFNQDISRVSWTSNLKKLTFGDDFNQPLDNVHFPDSLEKLSFEGAFNQPLDNVHFPKSLERLFFEKFNQPIDNVKFPQNIREIKFGKTFNQPYDTLLNINTLKVFTIGNQTIIPTPN
jgi:hypothetical protein